MSEATAPIALPRETDLDTTLREIRMRLGPAWPEFIDVTRRLGLLFDRAGLREARLKVETGAGIGLILFRIEKSLAGGWEKHKECGRRL